MIENQKYMAIKEMLHKSKRSLINEIHSLLVRADTKERADIIYHM